MDAALHAKLGLAERRPDDAKLTSDLFALLQDAAADFTIFFRRLGDLGFEDREPPTPGRAVRDLFVDRERFDRWAVDYRARVAHEGRSDDERRVAMRAVNPKYVLRNHLAEQAIVQARSGDFAEVDRLCRLLERPFDEQPDHERYADLPPSWAKGLEVSCSS